MNKFLFKICISGLTSTKGTLNFRPPQTALIEGKINAAAINY